MERRRKFMFYGEVAKSRSMEQYGLVNAETSPCRLNVARLHRIGEV